MSATPTGEIKVVGKSGQISLGKRYAGKTLELQRLDDGSLLLRAVAMANSPEFQDFRLELSELKQVVGSLRRLRELDRNTLYHHSGVKREAIRHVRTPNGATAYALRLSEKIRGIAYRDGDFLRIISLHPDHDSAYER